MPAPEKLFWWNADSEETPDAYTRDPWTLTGAGGAIDDGVLDLNDASAVDANYYEHLLVPTDSTSARPYQRDWVWLQASVQGVAAAPGWASGASGIALAIDDGARALALSIGSTLRLIHPSSGAVIETINTSSSWLEEHTYVLLKAGTNYWAAFVDGRLVAQVGYRAAVTGSATPALARIGSLDPTGTSRARWRFLELGVNRATPPQWKVEQIFGSMPVPLQSRWTEIARAGLRATVGLLEGPVRVLEETWHELTARRLAQLAYRLGAGQRPAETSPAWTELEAADIAVERHRLRLTAGGVATTGIRAALSSPGGGSVETEYTVRATWTVRSYTPDAQGRLGPYMQVCNGNAAVTAQLVEVADGEAWVLTDDALSGAYAEIGSVQWLVDRHQEHTVEIQVLGRSLVLLLVEGRIVDRIRYTDFPASASHQVDLASAAGSASGVYTLQHVSAERRLCDLARRALFLQNAVERLIFVGGRERNDEIDTWMRHHFDVEALRGTTQGMLVELRRLTGNPDCYVVTDTTTLEHFLEVTYPDITPTFLEARGATRDVYVEFGIGCVNFGPIELARLAQRYLVPMSVPELTYHICLCTRLTADSTVPAPGTTRLTVTASAGFAAGQIVTIRSEDNSVSEQHTILAIGSSTSIDITETATAPYAAGSVLRTILLES